MCDVDRCQKVCFYRIFDIVSENFSPHFYKSTEHDGISGHVLWHYQQNVNIIQHNIKIQHKTIRQLIELEKKIKIYKNAATTSHPAGHSTDICRSSPGPCQTGTAWPRGCDSWVTGLFQVQTQLVPVNITESPLPPPTSHTLPYPPPPPPPPWKKKKRKLIAISSPEHHFSINIYARTLPKSM